MGEKQIKPHPGGSSLHIGISSPLVSTEQRMRDALIVMKPFLCSPEAARTWAGQQTHRVPGEKLQPGQDKDKSNLLILRG